MAGVKAEEITKLIVALAEPGSRLRALEAPHGPVSAFLITLQTHPAMG
jgi:hypothetical protein